MAAVIRRISPHTATCQFQNSTASPLLSTTATSPPPAASWRPYESGIDSPTREAAQAAGMVSPERTGVGDGGAVGDGGIVRCGLREGAGGEPMNVYIEAYTLAWWLVIVVLPLFAGVGVGHILCELFGGRR